jgi:RNA polymerase sigma-70 factor (ECF subfamily)
LASRLYWVCNYAVEVQMNEEQLIQAAQKGDLDAFNRLVVSYQGLAYNLAFRLLSDPAAAEDATQDAFIAAYRNMRRYRGGSFKAWLLRIVTNGSYDELRRQRRKPQTVLEPDEDNGHNTVEPFWLADPGEGPQELAERVELSRAIQRCLSQLEDEFRTAVVLVDVQGMDYSEAAQVMKRPLGTVKSRLARARSRLQACLHGSEELLPERFRLTREGKQ